MSDKKRVLVVEDDPLVSDVIVAVLDDTYPTEVVQSANSALDAIREGGVRIMLLDCSLPGGIGPELLIEADRTRTPVILMSGDPDRMNKLTDTPRPFIRKPFTLSGLLATVEQVLTASNSEI